MSKYNDSHIQESETGESMWIDLQGGRDIAAEEMEVLQFGPGVFNVNGEIIDGKAAARKQLLRLANDDAEDYANDPARVA